MFVYFYLFIKYILPSRALEVPPPPHMNRSARIPWSWAKFMALQATHIA